MATITIPKKRVKNQKLIAVPQSIYEEFLKWQKKTKEINTFHPTISEKKALERGRKNFAKGNYISLEKLRHELGFDN